MDLKGWFVLWITNHPNFHVNFSKMKQRKDLLSRGIIDFG